MPIIDLIKKSYVTARPWLVFILVLVLSFSPLFPIKEYLELKVGLIVLLAINSMFLIFDLYKEIVTRLDSIDSRLKKPIPTKFDQFSDALSSMETIIMDRLSTNNTIELRILAVTSQFTWKDLLESKVKKYLKSGSKSSQLNIKIALCDPITLEHWGQETLIADLERTHKGIKLAKKKWKEYIGSRINLEIYKYDNLQQWHGVLIDGDVLFLGRCRWDHTVEPPALTVGQNDYRIFELNDRFEGTEHINEFINWFRTCEKRNI